MYFVILQYCLESSAPAGSLTVCAAFRILRPYTLAVLGGLPCWQFLTARPSEGCMW